VQRAAFSQEKIGHMHESIL